MEYSEDSSDEINLRVQALKFIIDKHNNCNDTNLVIIGFRSTTDEQLVIGEIRNTQKPTH